MSTILLFGRLKQENPSEPSLNYITEFYLKKKKKKKRRSHKDIGGCVADN